MANLIYYITGGLCCYFSLIHPIPQKLSRKNRFLLLLYIYTTCLCFSHSLGQLSTYFTVSGTLLLIFFFTNHDFYSLSSALFGYIFAVTLNYITLFFVRFIFHISVEQLLSSDNLLIIL
jgi:two-component system sensor histidine kinase AgrC